MRCFLLLLLSVAMAAGPALADEVDEAVGRVVAAFEAEDSEALVALASEGEPDPWLVADVLLARSKHAAAEAFATHAPRPAADGLPAYVRAQREAGSETAVRDVLRRMHADLAKGDAEAALAAAAEVEPGPTTIPRLRVRMAAAFARQRLGDMEACGRLFVEAGAEARALGWLAGALEAYRMGGLAYFHLESHTETLEAWSVRLEVARALGQPRAEASALHHLGVVHRRIHRLDEAYELCKRALALHEAHGDVYGASLAVGEMAAICLRKRDYPAAKALFTRAIVAKRELGEEAEAASLLGNLGIVHVELGEYDDAKRAYEEALADHEKRGDESGVADVLNNLAGLAIHREAWSEALALFTRVLDLAEQRGDRTGVRIALGNLGAVYEGLGDPAAAVASHERSLEMARAAGDQLAVASQLYNLGVHAAEGERLDAAMARYMSALALLEEVPDPRLEAQVRWGIATVHHAAGDWVAAIDEARRAEPFVERLVHGLAEQEGAGARDLWVGVAELGLHAAMRAGSVADAVHFLESARAGTLRESLEARGALGVVLLPEALREREAAARRVEAEALAAYRALPRETPFPLRRAARKALLAARDAVEDVVAEVQRTAKAGASLVHPRADDVAVLQARIAPDEALLLYGLTPDEGVAVLLTRDTARLVVLADSAALAAAVEALHAEDKQADVGGAVAELQRLLVEPLALPDHVRRVLVSPVEGLAYLPLGLLLPDRDVAYVPSGTTHGLLFSDGERRGRRVLGLGDPDYRSKAAVKPLESLPGTRAEVEAIADVVLLGERATVARLREAIGGEQRWGSVHLACHGLVDTEHPLRSALALTADAESDGFLTGLDVFSMRIPADLVVLSACETGKGRLYRAEGIVGLTRAFMYAGTPRVICSLWMVDDDATRVLMERFYELWNPDHGEGLGAAEALRQAQAHVRSRPKWSHPHYWAAWVLWGLPQ